MAPKTSSAPQASKVRDGAKSCRPCTPPDSTAQTDSAENHCQDPAHNIRMKPCQVTREDQRGPVGVAAADSKNKRINK